MFVSLFIAFIRSLASVLTLLPLKVFWGFIKPIIVEEVAFPSLLWLRKAWESAHPALRDQSPNT